MYSTEAEDIEMVDSMMIDVSTLRTATGDFDESNKLGEGGFGAVYKVALDRHASSDSSELKNKAHEFMKHRVKCMVSMHVFRVCSRTARR